jgi:hypothetical protein
MLKQAKTLSLATFEAKYQQDLECIKKTETNTCRKALGASTKEYRR